MEDKNYEKQEIYKNMKTNLSKALKSGFYYEAIFIEYAIIEDRCSSLLRHAGVTYINNKGYEDNLSDKLNKLRRRPVFCASYVRKRLSLDFIEQIRRWKNHRNELIHGLAKIPYDNEDIKITAEQGNDIVNALDKAVKALNTHFNNIAENK